MELRVVFFAAAVLSFCSVQLENRGAFELDGSRVPVAPAGGDKGFSKRNGERQPQVGELVARRCKHLAGTLRGSYRNGADKSNVGHPTSLRTSGRMAFTCRSRGSR